jgi:hypothetical protein
VIPLAVKNSFKAIFVIVMKKIGLILSAILIIVLMGAGIGVGLILRSWGLDYSGVVVPSVIIEIIACIIAYSFAQNFFPKASRDYAEGPSKKGSRAYREADEVETDAATSELPERNVKS